MHKFLWFHATAPVPRGLLDTTHNRGKDGQHRVSVLFFSWFHSLILRQSFCGHTDTTSEVKRSLLGFLIDMRNRVEQRVSYFVRAFRAKPRDSGIAFMDNNDSVIPVINEPRHKFIEFCGFFRRWLMAILVLHFHICYSSNPGMVCSTMIGIIKPMTS